MNRSFTEPYIPSFVEYTNFNSFIFNLIVKLLNK
jgi:hypothetical protein